MPNRSCYACQAPLPVLRQLLFDDRLSMLTIFDDEAAADEVAKRVVDHLASRAPTL